MMDVNEAVRTCGACGALAPCECEIHQVAAHEERMIAIMPDKLKRVLFIGEAGDKLAEMIFASCEIVQQGDTLKMWVREDNQ